MAETMTVFKATLDISASFIKLAGERSGHPLSAFQTDWAFDKFLNLLQPLVSLFVKWG